MRLVVLVHDHFHDVIAGEAELIEREPGRMRSRSAQPGADHLQRHVRHPQRKNAAYASLCGARVLLRTSSLRASSTWVHKARRRPRTDETSCPSLTTNDRTPSRTQHAGLKGPDGAMCMSDDRSTAGLLDVHRRSEWPLPSTPAARCAQTRARSPRARGTRHIDPLLLFKVDPMNGRKAQESGLRLNT